MNYSNIKNHIVKWMSDYATSNNMKGFTIGVSGGIDSGVVSTLCAETNLPVLILEMPIHQSNDQVTRAKNHIKWLKDRYPNVTSREIDLTNTYETFKSSNVRADVNDEKYEFTLSNTRSRLRMMTLYQFSGQLGYLVAGTGNRVEDFGVGFFTKGGDQVVDLSPIGDLMKSEVYNLGKELGLIEEILNAVPTDGLHDDGRTDEEQIGATYDELEWAMNFDSEFSLTTNRHERIAKELMLSDREREVLNIYQRFHNSNKHKMVETPVCSIPTHVKYSKNEKV